MAEKRHNITIRISTSLWTALKEVARANNITLTELCQGFLEEGIRRKTLTPGRSYLMPEIEALLEKHLLKIEKNFSALLGRTAIEGGATKRLLMYLLVTSELATTEEVVRTERDVWAQSRKALQRPIEGIEELVISLRSKGEKL